MKLKWNLAVWFLFLTAQIVAAQNTTIFGISNVWRYNQTDNLNDVNWIASNYNDSSWPSGPGLLYCETNSLVTPRNTPLTIGPNTYYFRTHFTLNNPLTNMVLTFSNKIDDGAVFYLNGREIQRVRISKPPAIIYYATGSISKPASDDAEEWDVFSVPATNGVAGDNVLAVEVHQITPDDDDIVFGSALSLHSMTVNRGPYLQLLTTNSVVIRWRTDLPTNGIVRFGTNQTNLQFQVSDSKNTNDHELTVPNLTPDTKYFYSVGASSGTLAGGDTNHFFITAPLPGTAKSVRIWALGDVGTADSKARSVRNAYSNFNGNRHTDICLLLGDNAYLYGADPEYQAAIFDMFHDLLRQTIVWPTLGNHETNQRTNFNDNYDYFSQFTLPTNGIAGGVASGTAHYYSFDFANIHFVCLDSMTASRATNDAMATWLRADMEATTQLWKIAFWHHAPYSKGSHDSDTDIELVEMRQNIVPILEKYGIDLVLCGHSHGYERSLLIDGHYGLSTTMTSNMVLNAGSGNQTNAAGPYTKSVSAGKAHQGAVYVVAGSSAHVSGGWYNHPAMYLSENELGSMVIDIDGDSLTAKYLRETGVVDDEFTIVKRDPKIVPEAISPSGLRLNITNVASKKTNFIDASATLSNWTTISTNVVTSNTFQFLDTQNTNFIQRFYRMRTLP